VISDAEGNVLARFPAQGWQIAWSPDSTRVAVWDTWDETIGVYGLDGARQTQLTMPAGSGGGGDNDPVWMPDGTSLMVGNMDVPIDGSSPRRLQPEGDYSPDGSLVVYGDHGSLMIARSDGSEPREVSGDWASVEGVTWSPTGEQIAFITSGPGSSSSPSELRILDVATGSVTLLPAGQWGSELGVIGFSPRGDRILLRSVEGGGRDEQRSLWSIGVDGSDPRLLVAGTMYGEWLSR
jgi:Tol biopolymer transport system component